MGLARGLAQAGEGFDQPGVVGRHRPGGVSVGAARPGATSAANGRPPGADGAAGARRSARPPPPRSGWPNAVPATARAAIAMAFHSVRTLSSRPGRGRCERRSRQGRRPCSISGAGRAHPGPGATGCSCPPSCPREAPYHSATSAPATLVSSAIRPGVKAPLFALAVGVLGRGPGPFGQAQRRAEQVADRLLHHLAVTGRRRSTARRGCTPARVGRCRRASFRNGARASAGRCCSGRNPRPGGRKYPRSSWRRVCGAGRAQGAVARAPPVLGQDFEGGGLGELGRPAEPPHWGS